MKANHHPLTTALLLSVCPMLHAAGGIGWHQDNKIFKPATAHEGPVAAFLKPAAFESQQVYAKDRFPNIIVATNGTVIAAWNGVQVRRSTDAGATWGEPITIAEGFMGGMVRLPVLGRDILLFSNIVSPKGRKNGHVWASFDGGKTWPLRRQVFEGNFAYSALNAGRPGTASEGWIYLLYEGGPQGGGTVARFNLSWLLEGEKTGDGRVPNWSKGN